MSLAPGTSSRTSTPSRAAARSACVYADVPTKYASVSHRLARKRRDHESSRKVPVSLGTPATTCSAHVAGRVRSRPIGNVVRRQRRPADGRQTRANAAPLGDGRPADLDARVAPWLHPLRRIALPFRADAQAGDESDPAVDDDRLAMIAGQPAQRAVQARSVERAHLGAGPPAATTARRRRRAEPVVDDPDVDPGPRLRRERVGELAADVVVGDDVALEQDRAFGAPRWRRATPGNSRGVEQQADRVASMGGAPVARAARGRSARVCRTRRSTWASRGE